MLGSLFVALGIVTCSAAGGHCDSPSTQLVRSEQTAPASKANVTISDDLDGQETRESYDDPVTP